MTIKVVRKCLEGDYKDNPLAAISHFHWVEDLTGFEGFYTIPEMIDFIKYKGTAYILDPADILGKTRIPLSIGKTADGTKYIRTVVGGHETVHLLDLPECER